VATNVLVTGAAGFIGSHLCTRLATQQGIHVTGIDDLRSGSGSRIPEQVNHMNRDISEISVAEWTELLTDVDIVYHLAAEKYNASKSSPERLLLTNVNATERLARAAALANVGRVVFTSSLYSYGSMGPKTMDEKDVPEPSTLYGASKLMGEGILRSVDRELGLSWNVARLFFIYGPWQFAHGGYKSVIIKNFERALRGESMQINGSGNQALDYIYVDDCVEALIALATSNKDHKVVNVASGVGTAIRDLVTVMSSIAGCGLNDLEHAPADWTEGSRRVGAPSEIERYVGWRATTSIELGLERVWNWISNK